MAFDNPTRNRLQRLVGECRNLLTKEFDSKLQEIYGIYADEGRVLDLERLPHLDDQRLRVAVLLRERIEYLAAGGRGAEAAVTEAVRRVLREQAFTILNRFVALRMTEERGIIVEAVGAGFNSKAFKTFSEVAFSGLGDSYQRYRVFLLCLCDEMATDLGVLFDRASPYGLLFPRQEVLLQLFDLLNDSDLKPLWKEDETVGWIYQYFNDPTERKKMREESAAPRNSRELAVRNQFFTPRYVVEFLTDNTLGRIWYEMCGGATSLKEKCRYLVCRPNEVFVKPGEDAPAQPKQDNLSQEELLKQPVFIPHRPLKDPRTILMLDPACGSMHFGLYAFDLYEIIYEEAWELEGVTGAPSFARSADMKSLHEMFATKKEFLRQVPRLIIEHNLHGIDIDPRCAQIAGLSLWLRAQKSWQRLGLKPAERPRITRSNIVCAEPMPGEKELLREFVEKEFPAAERGVFLLLLETIFDKMQLAGEAGSLLKIEEEIKAAVETAREIWQKAQTGPSELLSTGEMNAVSKQSELAATADLRLLTSEFFERVEERVFAALRDYAEQAENGGGFQRRLFAEDAARGFALIDICLKRYDVALMNPPFGEGSLPSKPYIDETYGDTKGDVYKAFVECFQARLVPAGYLGIISSRSGFFLGQSEDWRTRVVLRLFRPIAIADLGIGVLDAMVEVAAYILRNLSASENRDLTLSVVPALEKVVRDKHDRFSLPKWQAARDSLKRHQAVAELEHLEHENFIQRCPGDIIRYTPLWRAVKAVSAPPEPVFPVLMCIKALKEVDKESLLYKAIRHPSDAHMFVCDPGEFMSIPSSPFAYSATRKTRTTFKRLQGLGSSHVVASGTGTLDDFRFLRLWLETPCEAESNGWFTYAKGGAYSPFYFDQHLAVNWFQDGAEMKAWIIFRYGGGQWSRNIRSTEYYFRPGITWPRRSQRGLSIRTLPADCIFGDKGPAAFDANDSPSRLLALLALTNSSVFRQLVSLQIAFGSYEVGIIQRTPIPSLNNAIADELSTLGRRAWSLKYALDIVNSSSHTFIFPAVFAVLGGTLAERTSAWIGRVRTSEATVAAIQARIDDLTFQLYELDAADRISLASPLTLDTAGTDAAGTSDDDEDAIADVTVLAADLLGYGLGVAFGRWDIRYTTGERAAPEFPDPFAPLPACPPGQLQNAQGLPARPEDVPAAYPLKNIPWAGILVDDESHQCDLVARVREVIEIIWTGSVGSPSAEAIEHEACEILGVKSLRDYFRKSAGFFADHLKRYSKSRRQAPIYWPLSTASGSYTLWIYYHRLTDQTLFQCVNDFVKPKITEVEGDLSRLTTLSTDKPGARAEIERLTTLRAELVEFRDELLRVAQLPFKPNLNDGVLITASPLWKLFRLPKWQKDLKACWTELERGDYDWAHIALTLWPDRVRTACKKDRSIAIAHGLEDLCDVKAPEKKAKRGEKKKDVIQPEFEEASE